MPIGKTATSILACIAFVSAAFAGELEKGAEAAQAGDFETAFAKWMPMAKDGDPIAQHNIAKMYYLGDFVDQDKTEAARWYLRSAKQGFPAAQRLMGFMYANGIGVQRDLLKGAQWSNLAAKNGDSQGKVNLEGVLTELGWAYMGGQHGLSQDLDLSCMWFTIAAENGSKHAVDMAESLCGVSETTGVVGDLDATKSRCVESGYADCD